MDQTRTLGYAIEYENHNALMKGGLEPKVFLKRFKEQVPTENPDADPLSVLNVLDQGQIGSCQGQSLAKMFQICYFLETGKILNFSAMCGYIMAQKYDRLDGRDVGSTLSGGQQVATKNGMCLEVDWPYPSRYSSRVPTSSFPFKLASAQPTNDPDLIMEALEMGLPVQTGMSWNRELEQEHVERYTGRGAQGGHATTLWHKKNGHFCQINSWSPRWNGDGCSTWTEQALEDIVNYRGNTFVIYAPEGMIYPDGHEIPIEV